MTAWITVITAIAQLIQMVLKNKFEKDALEKVRKDDLHARLKDAIKNKDTDRINDLLVSLKS